MGRWDVNTPVADVSHDVVHDLAIPLVALTQVAKDSRANHHLGCDERNERFVGEGKVIQILRGIQLHRRQKCKDNLYSELSS